MLSLMYIESGVLRELNYDDIIRDFANQEARKANFFGIFGLISNMTEYTDLQIAHFILHSLDSRVKFSLLPPPPNVKEVTFSPLSVCLSVCLSVQDMSKSCGWIWIKFC